MNNLTRGCLEYAPKNINLWEALILALICLIRYKNLKYEATPRHCDTQTCHVIECLVYDVHLLIE